MVSRHLSSKAKAGNAHKLRLFTSSQALEMNSISLRASLNLRARTRSHTRSKFELRRGHYFVSAHSHRQHHQHFETISRRHRSNNPTPCLVPLLLMRRCTMVIALTSWFLLLLLPWCFPLFSSCFVCSPDASCVFASTLMIGSS